MNGDDDASQAACAALAAWHRRRAAEYERLLWPARMVELEETTADLLDLGHVRQMPHLVEASTVTDVTVAP